MNNMSRDETGRLISPLLWNPEVENLLANNYDLARKILNSNLKKLKAKSDVLTQYDDVIRKQLDENIIERVNLNEYLNSNEGVSFLPHTAVIRENVDTTRCRVVFLANLADRRLGGLSHNQVSFSGRNLNNTLLDSILYLRFDKYLLVFDLCSAFLQIRIRESDTKKLLFLWFENVKKGNFNIVGYRFLRLGFGLKFSPNILLCALHYILIKNAQNDNPHLREMKKKLRFLTYMDNLGFTSSSPSEMEEAYTGSIDIFKEFGFQLQKFATNLEDLQSRIDSDHEVRTPSDIKLFGLIWNRLNDSFVTNEFKLNPSARTKRSIVSTVHEQYDLLGIVLPFIMPAKLFMHVLQSKEKLGWDQDLGDELCSEWTRICSKINNVVQPSIQKNIGNRSSEFALIICSDSSKLAMGLVVYLQDLQTGQRSFIFSKTRMIGKKLKLKSIPILELCALSWAIEVIVSLYEALTKSMYPLNILRVLSCSDSTIAIAWVVWEFGNSD